ncbi:transcriptional regulator [Haloferax mucosum ATCC BAA-1512]|uniref:HTH-type transcriptional regulator n=1 Tax=Haloferax mucosum ATCC BAA-1512 TaxID=662479 RepID=M0IMI5_9EURY|nr:transcriptional regulator [Haloferax mucosum]ELZ97048.1 transcriptional regulator [Haloferax mucosum ATCC BAA-1512]
MTDDAYDDAKLEIADAMARTAEMYGLNRSYGHIYGLLYFVGEPMSLDELVAESGYAKSTVSNAMSALEPYHLVHRQSSPGEGRKVYFEAETDFWTIMQEFFEQQGRREIRIMTRALETAQASLDDAPETDRTSHASARVAELEAFYDQAETLLSFFTRASPEVLFDVVSEVESRTVDDEP